MAYYKMERPSCSSSLITQLQEERRRKELYSYDLPPEYSAHKPLRNPKIVFFTEIRYFTPLLALRDILSYVDLWDMDKEYIINTKVLPNVDTIPGVGNCHHIDLIFYYPKTYPLKHATVTVHFHVYVSKLVPENYPILVTYQMEGQKEVHQTMGIDQTFSLHFQKCWIVGKLKARFEEYERNLKEKAIESSLTTEEEKELNTKEENAKEDDPKETSTEDDSTEDDNTIVTD